jgi:hypothetical protein
LHTVLSYVVSVDSTPVHGTYPRTEESQR